MFLRFQSKNYILPKTRKYIINFAGKREKKKNKKLFWKNKTNLDMLSLDILHLFHVVFDLLGNIIHMLLFDLFEKQTTSLISRHQPFTNHLLKKEVSPLTFISSTEPMNQKCIS
ncbi:hypothetical protein PanWU01x14_122550 [Parasponia andersonii]|uniref:Uncharacterized protein n=1 Tax=Parasponia andersonii TaxID=3476 RepID=A0A2P5CUR5_PARAD|nr:hypothetical protein PanWU01x14_122550 [Parasponia andersonii]